MTSRSAHVALRFLGLCLVLALGGMLLRVPGGQAPAQAAGFSATCQAGPNPFPPDMGSSTNFPVKENSPARLEAHVSGGTGPFTYEWYHSSGGTYRGQTSTRTHIGSGSPYTLTAPADGFGVWEFQVDVTDTASGEVQTGGNCHYDVLPNPADRLDPGNLPSVNPVLFVPKDSFPGNVVPEAMVDQIQRSLRRIQAEYYEIYGATYRMNPLKVVVAPQTEAQMCGGDCTDRLASGTLVYNYALPQAKQAVGGCISGYWACVPYTKEIIVLAWGAGGWAGGWGPDHALAVVGDWAVATAGGVKTPWLEPDVTWTLDGTGVVDPNVFTVAHEMNHNIGRDDNNDFSYQNPQNPSEIAGARALPWLTEPMTDVQSPTVSFTSPVNGSIVSGTIAVNLSASDTGGSGLEAAALLVDGYWQGVDASAPYSFSLDTTKLGHGSHKLTAIAYDNSGHIAKAEITVNVKNIVSGACDTSYPLDTGRVCYYDGIGFAGTYLGTLIDAPNFVTDNGNFGWWPRHDFGSGEVAFGQSDTVSGVWRAQFNFPATTYTRYNITFYTDDGVRFYVNDALVLDQWGDHAATYTTQLTLSGYTNLRIEWYENSGSAALSMKWAPTRLLMSDEFSSASLNSSLWSTANSGPVSLLDENFDSGSLNTDLWGTAASGAATLLDDTFDSGSLNSALWGVATGGGTTLLEDNFSSGSLNTSLWGTAVGGGSTVSQSGGYLTMTVPTAGNAYADLYSLTSFPVGSTFEARVYLSAGQWLDHKGIGYADARIGPDCGSGETQAAMWRGQDGDKYTETKIVPTSCNGVIRQTGYPAGWRTIKVVRVNSAQVDFYEDGVLLGTHTTSVPTGSIPIRFSAYTYTWGPSSPITIQVDWVKVTTGGPTVSQSGGYLTMTIPAAANAYADLYSRTPFPVGSTFEARVYLSAGQWYDHKGIGYADATVGADCNFGETQAAMWRGQDSDKYTETKILPTSCNGVYRQMGYPAGWRTIKVVRVSTTQVDFYEDGVLLGSHTSSIPTGNIPIRFSAYTYLSAPANPITIQVDWVKVTTPGPTISQSGGYLTMTIPAAANAYADLYSKTAFPVGTTLEARVYVSAGQTSDLKGIGYADARIGANCSQGETQAAMWRGQDSGKYSETKTGSASYTCSLRQSSYPAGWRTIKVVRVSSTQADFYENGVLLGSQTTNIPTGSLPIRFSAAASAAAPASPITIQIDWVKVTIPGPTISQSGGYLTMTVPAAPNAYADLFSNTSFPVGTTIEARVYVSAGQASDRKGMGYADARVGADCSQGETQAAMWRGQESNKYTETKTGSASYTCYLLQSSYPTGWRTIKIVRVSNTQVDFYEDGNLVVRHTSYVPTGNLPIRFSAFTSTSAPLNPITIQVDWVKVTQN